MTLEVTIERDASGRLHAHALQRGEDESGLEETILKGRDMLRDRPYRSIESAVDECNRQLRDLFKLVDPPDIVYIFPGQEQP